MKVVNSFLLILCIAATISAAGESLADKQTARDLVPAIFLQKKTFSKETVFLTKEAIGINVKADSFKAADGSRYLVVIYYLLPDMTSGGGLTELRIVKIDKFGKATLLEKPNENIGPGQLENYCEIKLADLDNDGVNEVIIRTTDSKNEPASSFVYKWNGQNLTDITPTRRTGKSNLLYSVFDDLFISNQKISGKSILNNETLVALPNGNDYYTVTSLFILDKAGFTKLGDFDFAKVIEKNTHKYTEVTFNITSLKESMHLLSIKNISDHSHAVRGEITINDTVIFKPQDFCDSPQSGVQNQATRAGNHVPDDDSDRNEDHYKHCMAKTDLHADIKINPSNVVKVRLYGPKGSRILLGLDEKK